MMHRKVEDSAHWLPSNSVLLSLSFSTRNATPRGSESQGLATLIWQNSELCLQHC